MFWTIENYQRSAHQDLLDKMYSLRARVFHHELGWDVKLRDGREIDEYDEFNPVYLVWTDSRKETLFGSLRLLSTTGPTLLYDVFRRTFPENLCLSAPSIWEGTRLCVDQYQLKAHFATIDCKRAFCLMLLALCETALKYHIETLVSNFEPPTKRLYKAAGAPLSFLGCADGFGKRPVCAGTFEVSAATLKRMREAQNIDRTLLSPEINGYLGSRFSQAA